MLCSVYPTSVVLVHHLYAIMTPVVKNIYILSVIMLYVRLYTVLTKERNGGLFNIFIVYGRSHLTGIVA